MSKEFDLASMSSNEIIAKVRSKEIESFEYHTVGEYLKAMETP